MDNLHPAYFAGKSRLGYALAASISIHLGLLVGFLNRMPAIDFSEASRGAGLPHVRLRADIQPSVSSNAVQTSVPVTASTDSPPPQRAPAKAREVLSARFITEPDFDVLRDIPVTLSGRIHFRLRVSSIGTVSAVEVAEHDPVPLDLMNALKNSLAQTRLHPAEQEGQPVDSLLDITVWFEPSTVP